MKAKLLFKGIFIVFFLCSYSVLAQAPNDSCDGAESIECNTSKGGTTVGATFDDVGSCGTSNTAPGVWYKFVGDGSVVTASTCNAASYDTKISVFEGSCGSLICVDGNDDGSGCSGFTSEVEFTSVADTEYYILVHGFSSQTGSFTLTLTCEAAPETPANDLCADAEPIACGDVVTGDTTAATGDGSLPFCGTSATESPGVWYVFSGTGDMIDITASTEDSDFDTKLFVFSGSCGDLVCIDGDDDGGPGLTSEVNFMTEPGVAYYIYVTGFFGTFSGPRSGPYSLSISCALQAEIDEDCNTVYYGYAPESCATLTAEASYGVPPYSYAWSNGSTDASIEVCPGETTIYSVTVTDAAGNSVTDSSSVIVVNTVCGNQNNDGKVLICHRSQDGSFSTLCVAPSAVQAHLDHGDSLGGCDSLTCDTPPACDLVVSPADGATDVAADTEISWTAVSGYVTGYTVSIGTTSGGTDLADNVDVGLTTSYDPGILDYNTTYYVNITPYNGNGSAEGCAESSFTTEENPCNFSSVIECGQTLTGSTVGASVNVSLSSCGFTSLNTAPGVWFEFPGTGDNVLVSLDGSDYDTKLGVFSGDCDALVCVDGDDDGGPGLTSEIEFSSVNGTLYRILVTGFGSNAGNYNLSVTCSTPPTPPCESAEEVFCGSVVNGSTDGVEGVDFDSTCTMSDYGKWYKFVGDGSLYTIEATTSGYDIEMAITTGACPNLTNIDCVDSAFSSGTESFELQSEAGATYYIYIAHWSSSSSTTGNYTLSISCGDPLPPSPDPINSIDCSAGASSYSYCYPNNDSLGWTFTSSNGAPLSFSFSQGTVESSTYDQLNIYDGTDNTAAILYSNPGSTTQLGGVSVVGTSGSIYVEFSSDFIVSCQSSSSYEQWLFEVGCSPAAAANPDGLDATIDWGLSPNPSIGTVDLDLKNFVNSDVMIELVDFTGKVLEVHSLKNLQNPKYRMQLNGQLTNGMYLLRLSSSNEVSAKRLILNR